MTLTTEGSAVPRQSDHWDFDFIVIGSGFGGSVTAHRLVEKGYKVAVMEMGRRWTPENLPLTSWSIHRWFWRPGLALRGFFNMRFFRHVTILHGCAVGGGSITYASTLLRAPDKVWDNGYWAGLADWKAEMPQHYDTASRMLGVTENKILGPGDRLLKRAAEAAGVGDSFYRTSVGIFQAAEGQPGGQTFPDPFFGGEGPERTTCNACGGCMMGCRHGAKNTLDQNYLYLAEKHGAIVFPETRVVDVRPLNDKPDGRRWLRSHNRQLHRVVQSASGDGSLAGQLSSLLRRWGLPSFSSCSSPRARCRVSVTVWANTFAPIPSPSSAFACPALATIYRRAWPSAPGFILTSTPTSKPYAIPAARTRCRRGARS